MELWHEIFYGTVLVWDLGQLLGVANAGEKGINHLILEAGVQHDHCLPNDHSAKSIKWDHFAVAG